MRRKPRPESNVESAAASSAMLLFLNLHIVVDRKNSRNAVGPYSGRVLVRFAIHHSFESHMTVLNDDPNWLNYGHGISLETGISVDGSENSAPQTIVHRRGW